MLVPCKLSIVSTVDGKETVFSRDGEGEFSFLRTSLFYRDEGAEVCVETSENEVVISRRGDYTMELFLREGKKTKGTLGILGQSGEVEVYTEKIGHTLTDNSFMLIASYHLCFGADTQKMKIRMTARLSDKNKDKGRL